MPNTLQATIAARIDRLGMTAKHALYAGAVVGLRFGPDLLTAVLGETDDSGPALGELLRAELIDQVRFTPHAEYAFRHPLIRSVAYESQLKSGRAELHRRLATTIEQRDPGSVDENAALIAEHLEAAGDLCAAFDWHMRAGAWSTNRDLAAARMSWQRARAVADLLPADDPDRTAMRIAPRTLMCGTSWQAGGSVADTGFDELKELCDAAGDKVSLAIGMTGLVFMLASRRRQREAAGVASELSALVESIGDPTLTVGLLFAAAYAKIEAGEVTEGLRLTQRIIDLADGDPTLGNLLIGSPLTMATSMRGFARLCLGLQGWRDDADAAIAMASTLDPTSYVAAMMYKYILAIPIGARRPDATALRETAEGLQIAEQSGDNFTLCLARIARGIALVHHGGPDRDEGLDLLGRVRDAAVTEQFTLVALPIADHELARETARNGDLDSAIESSRELIDDMFVTGEMVWRGPATTVLTEALLQRGTHDDLEEAQGVIDRLAAVPTDPGFVLHELLLLRLRALLARAHGDENSYREFMERVRTKAAAAGFEAHIAAAHPPVTAPSNATLGPDMR